VALFALGDRLTLLQGFTTDMRRLIAAMNSPAGHPKLTSWGNNSDLSKDCTVIARRFQAAQRTLDAFVDLGQFLAAAPGRKNLLWFSSSFQALPLPTSGDFEKNIQLDSSSNSPFDFLSNSPDQISNCTPSYKILSERLRKVSTELAVSQTAVYPIDTRGLKSEPADYGGSGSESQPENGKGDNSTLAEKTVAWIHVLDASQATMREIAEATGGEAFVNTNNLARAASRAVDMGSYYYTLSYSPANAKFDGSLRRIRVSLRKRDSKQNYQLTYRTAYYADDPDRAVPVSVRQDALEAALVHGEPNAHSILFKVQIDPAGAEKPAPQAEAPAHGTKESAKAVPEKVQTYDLRFSILASQMNLATSADGRSRGALDIAVAAYAADGRRLGGSKQHLEAAIPSPLIDKTSDEGFFHRMRVDVPVNAAGIRVVVRDPTSGRVGSVEIAVPL
jgi:VWFA-related protein